MAAYFTARLYFSSRVNNLVLQRANILDGGYLVLVQSPALPPPPLPSLLPPPRSFNYTLTTYRPSLYPRGGQWVASINNAVIDVSSWTTLHLSVVIEFIWGMNS